MRRFAWIVCGTVAYIAFAIGVGKFLRQVGEDYPAYDEDVAKEAEDE